jgi:cation diffusion facilitator family transporter
VNFWGNLGLAVLKLLCGIVGYSKALLADAVHSIADVIIAGFVLITLRIQDRSPDESHPYGYGNIEFVASAFIGITLIITSIFIAVYSLRAIIRGDMPEPGTIAVLALIVGAVGNELMYQHSLCAGRKVNSPAMVANARENRADVYSSLAALVMVIGAKLGLRFLDPIAAIGVAALIAKFGIETLHGSADGLVDRAIEEEEIEKINDIASSVEGVEGIASVKARRSGRGIWIDLDVQVKPQATVAEGNAIAERVKSQIEEQIPHIGNVAVRFKPFGVAK